LLIFTGLIQTCPVICMSLKIYHFHERSTKAVITKQINANLKQNIIKRIEYDCSCLCSALGYCSEFMSLYCGLWFLRCRTFLINVSIIFSLCNFLMFRVDHYIQYSARYAVILTLVNVYIYMFIATLDVCGLSRLPTIRNSECTMHPIAWQL